jgi:cardiolipin synthase A/B
MYDLEANARPLLSPILSGQDAEIERLEGEGVSRARWMMLVRRNSRFALTRRNVAEILQNATEFYPRMMEDIKAAQKSIQYFIWGADGYTERIKDLLVARSTTYACSMIRSDLMPISLALISRACKLQKP